MNNRKLPLLFLLSICAWGQINPATLPPWVVGAGYDWTRGSTYQSALDVTVAKQFSSNSRWYWWNTLSTPITFHKTGSPMPTAVESGGAWVAAQTANGRGAFSLIVQGTLSQIQTQAGSTTEPGMAGTFAVTYQFHDSWYLMAFAKTASGSTSTTTTTTTTSTSPSSTTTTTTNALASVVFQLGAQVMFGFPPSNPTKVTPQPAPTVKMMREVMRRAGLPEGDVK
jgi:hypothetical protein